MDNRIIKALKGRPVFLRTTYGSTSEGSVKDADDICLIFMPVGARDELVIPYTQIKHIQDYDNAVLSKKDTQKSTETVEVPST
jgi:hypothetical protein